MALSCAEERSSPGNRSGSLATANSREPVPCRFILDSASLPLAVPPFLYRKLIAAPSAPLILGGSLVAVVAAEAQPP
jgi:hypothetical protein